MSLVSDYQKTMLRIKDNRAAGEREGAKDFLTSVARFFVKTCFYEKCGVF